MTGASKHTVRIDYINANWSAGAEPESAFELLIVTEDDQRHSLPISTDQLATLGPLLHPDRVLLFDPEGPTIIIGNLVGQWFQPDWAHGNTRTATPAR